MHKAIQVVLAFRTPFPWLGKKEKSLLTLLAALGGSTPETMLQQLMSARGAGPCHQAHSGLMQEHLKGRRVHQTTCSLNISTIFQRTFVLRWIWIHALGLQQLLLFHLIQLFSLPVDNPIMTCTKQGSMETVPFKKDMLYN